MANNPHSSDQGDLSFLHFCNKANSEVIREVKKSTPKIVYDESNKATTEVIKFVKSNTGK
jgi:hypothetical protein